MRCIFENVVETTDTCQRHVDFVSSFAKTYADELRNLQAELTCLADCFEQDVQELFRLHQPSSEFSDLVSNMRLRTGQAVLPFVFEDRASIRENEHVVSFDQHLSYLKQRKFSANRKEHVLQVKKAMDQLCDGIADAVGGHLASFVDWYKEAKTREVALKLLITETQYAQREINKKLVNEIETVGRLSLVSS